MPYYKAQHEVFVRAVIRHGDQHLAYRQAYPKATKESAYTAAIRLLRQPHIKQRVATALLAHKQQEQVRAQEREEHKRRRAEEDILQKRRWLAKVVRREVTRPRYFNLNGRIVMVQEDLSPFIILRAIELDSKYEYGYSPKIILDRQFAKLYTQATRPAGLAHLTRTSPRCSSAATSPFQGGTGTIPPWMGEAPQGQGDVSRHKPQNASKKLTDSKQNPHPTIRLASNKPARCNKIKGRPARTSTAPTHPATVFHAHYTIVDIESPPSGTAESRQVLRSAQNDRVDLATGDTAQSPVVILSGVECNETQRRICLISGTATPRQITSCEKVLRDAQNDRVDSTLTPVVISSGVECNGTKREICLIGDTAASRQITFGEKVPPDGRNDRVDLATKKLTDLNGNRRPGKLSGNNKQGPCNKTGATAESQEIYLDNNCISNGLGEMSSPDGRNDDCYLASRKPASAVWREENHLNAVAAVKIFSRPIKPGDRNDESKPQGDSKLF